MKDFSIVLPCFKRLANIKYVLQSLSEQNFEKDGFEVLVCSYEYSFELFQEIQKYNQKIHIRAIFTNEVWNVSRARNMATRLAEGEHILFLDADILGPVDFLNRIQDFYRDKGMDCVQVGYLYGYEDNVLVESYERKDYSYYQDFLTESKRPNMELDYRDKIENIELAWAFCWTAFIVVPRKLLQDNSIMFDETFTGWGAEDLEWAYRIQQSGIEIYFNHELWAMHLPHKRNNVKNYSQKDINYYRFLNKFQDIEVELVGGLGDKRSNKVHTEVKNCITEIESKYKGRIGVAQGTYNGERHLFVDVIMTEEAKLKHEALEAYCDIHCYFLIGIYLPFTDNYFNKIHLMPAFYEFSEEVKGWILRELKRLSNNIVSWSNEELEYNL